MPPEKVLHHWHENIDSLVHELIVISKSLLEPTCLSNLRVENPLFVLAVPSTKEKNPDAPVYLHTLHPVVRERFTFFFASLRTIEACGAHQRRGLTGSRGSQYKVLWGSCDFSREPFPTHQRLFGFAKVLCVASMKKCNVKHCWISLL